MVAACHVQDVPRITAALSVSNGLQIPGPSSVDPSRVVDTTRIVQIKVGKVPCVWTSPHDLDHMPPVAARHRSLPRDDTGQNLPGPFIGNDQLTGPETSPVTGQH
ncbi:hypothetical protein DPMN_104523 [Dreissena polymorpha]|uniref:Uncharacterized protein n=1 Tax=Dreissena polymorpha TaxID=45954 RepID=A0A9D4K178_DREPO|nr:hypothetical protein DPMN_104523 [Dreissena polymorpha]